MPTPQITITPAGFSAIVNAENTGTAPVKITQVGLTAQHFDVATVGAAVPNETKRLTTFGGRAIADDTLHLNVRDDGQDTYTLRGFGLYLEDGTLFAVYSQATPIMEKAAAATLLLATDIRFTNITATSIEVGDVDFINPPASTTQLGVVRLATEQEADGGADHTTAITPRGLAGYINRRFGAGAPSEFVKGLLGAATAAIFRVELGLKSAATRDEGHGNGLNADLLDGAHGDYYLDWKNFIGLPNSFTPAPHSHAIANVTGLQVALDNRPRLLANDDWMSSSGNWLTANKIYDQTLSPLRWTAPADYTSIVSLPGTDSEVGLALASTFSDANRFWLRGRHDLGGTNGWQRWKPWLEVAFHGTDVTFRSLNTTSGYDFGSSRKLKDIEGAMPYGLAEVRRISTLIGMYKPEYNNDGRRRLFFDAEQFAEVMPEVVDIAGVEFNGERVPSIKLDQVMPPAYRAIAQLADIVDALAEQVATLRGGQVG